jgi:transcriptional regulator
MYIPPAFRVEDANKLAAFIQRHSFATLITYDGTAPFASHLPMLYRPDVGSHGTLVAHMARANPQWRHFAPGRAALVVFQGPHSYISPSWYQTEPAYGIPAVFTEHERVVSLLRETVSTYEASFERRWPGNLPEDFRDKLIQAIVAFEIPITRIEGKFKLGQNRPAADIQGVFDALSRADDSDSRALARMMRTECSVQDNT